MEQCFPIEKMVHTGQFIRLVARSHGVFELILARPEVRNAFHADMILEIRACLTQLLPLESTVRVLVLSGQGAVFSSGADLEDMRSSASLDFAGNLERARGLALLFRQLASFPAPVVAVVKGAAIGGAMGLVACADLTLASAEAVFATPECRLGIVAATISPYLVRRLGVGCAGRMLYTGRRFSAREAQGMGLVQEVLEAASEADFEAQVARHLKDVLAGGPEAARRTKALFTMVSPLPDDALLEYTATCLAEARGSAEGRAGLEAFFARGTPPWAKELVFSKGAGGNKA